MIYMSETIQSFIGIITANIYLTQTVTLT